MRWLVRFQWCRWYLGFWERGEKSVQRACNYAELAYVRMSRTSGEVMRKSWYCTQMEVEKSCVRMLQEMDPGKCNEDQLKGC